MHISLATTAQGRGQWSARRQKSSQNPRVPANYSRLLYPEPLRSRRPSKSSLYHVSILRLEQRSDPGRRAKDLSAQGHSRGQNQVLPTIARGKRLRKQWEVREKNGRRWPQREIGGRSDIRHVALTSLTGAIDRHVRVNRQRPSALTRCAIVMDWILV